LCASVTEQDHENEVGDHERDQMKDDQRDGKIMTSDFRSIDVPEVVLSHAFATFLNNIIAYLRLKINYISACEGTVLFRLREAHIAAEGNITPEGHITFRTSATRRQGAALFRKRPKRDCTLHRLIHRPSRDKKEQTMSCKLSGEFIVS